MKWVVIALIALLLGLFALSAATHDPQKSRQMAAERDLIDRCRAAQDDELQELSTRRLMQQGCDKMEADYRAKWGVGP